MKKIPTLFKRDYSGNRQVYNEITEGCEWIYDDGVVATPKYDGTCCMVKGKSLYKRFDAKKGREIPLGAIPCEPERDEHTGHWPHWVKIDKDNKADKWHVEAFADQFNLEDGTYELCGPKINGNKHGYSNHILIKHGEGSFQYQFSADFEDIKASLKSINIEGIVFYHPDGRMCKIKKKDFGYKW